MVMDDGMVDRIVSDLRYLTSNSWEARSYSVNARDQDDDGKAREQVVTIVLRRREVKHAARG